MKHAIKILYCLNMLFLFIAFIISIEFKNYSSSMFIIVSAFWGSLYYYSIKGKYEK